MRWNILFYSNQNGDSVQINLILLKGLYLYINEFHLSFVNPYVSKLKFTSKLL